MVRKQRKRISYVLPLPSAAGGHRLGINGLAVDTENSLLYSGGRDGVICAWDLGIDLPFRGSLYDIPAQPSPHTPPSAHAGSPVSSRTHPPSPPTTLRYQVQAHSHWVNDIALVHSQQALVSASSDISVKIWRPTAFGNAPPLTIGAHGDYVKCLAYPGHNISWVASGGLDRKIGLWDLGGSGEVLKINVPDEEASGIKGSVYALAATSNLITGGGPESVVKIWDVRNGRQITKFVGHTDNVRGVLIAQDGDIVMSASSDQTVKVWSMTAGRCMYTLTMHNDSVWNLWTEDPQLAVFYSSDRSGLVAKTDSRGKAETDDGLCVAICRELDGVNRVVAGSGYLWTATSSSSINRWADVATEDAEVLLPESFSMPQRGSITTLSTLHKPRFHSGSISHSTDPPRFTNSPTPARISSTVFAVNQIPFKSVLRLSNIAAFPILRHKDSDAMTTYSVGPNRKASEPFEPDPVSIVTPMRMHPDHTIEGQHGLIKHIMLNDKRRVLTLDAAGEVMLWDLLKCVPIHCYGKRNIEDVVSEVNTVETIAPWCSVDTRTGCLTCVLEENNCFDAELYADEVDIPEMVEFKEDQRINLGKWVLRYLFDNLIGEEIRRDDNFRKKLFSTRYPAFALDRRPVPGTIAMPSPQMTSWFDASSAPASVATPKPTNGYHFPQTPGLAIGLATPAPPVPRISSPLLNPEDANHAAESPSTRTSSERHSADYFTARPTSGNTNATGQNLPTMAAALPTNGRTSQEGNALLQTPSNTEDPTTPSPERSGIKKFMRMNFMPKSLKKMDKGNDAKTSGPEDMQSDTDSRNSRTDERLLEDNFLGAVLRLRHAYEEWSNTQPTEKDLLLGTNKAEFNPPTPVPSAISPSLPNDTPVIKPPRQTVILIQEDSVDSGGVADLWEGTVASVGHEADLVERVAPSWLADVLLRNMIPQKEIVKISFILEPWNGLLPQVSTDGNTRLNANRMLRARKIMVYIAERIEPQPEKPDPNALKPEEYLELYCNDQLIPATMTLATIRAHVWRGGGDVLLYYKANGRKPIQGVPLAEA